MIVNTTYKVVASSFTLLALLVSSGRADERPNAMRPPSEQYNCLSLDQNGKTLPNPNVSSICGQNDALRNDCEIMRMRTEEPMMNNLHCFFWRRVDVRPGIGTVQSPATRAQTSGGR